MTEPSQNELKIWIAGASGFSGKALVDDLYQQQGFQPIPHIRPESSRLDTLQSLWEQRGVNTEVTPWTEVHQRLLDVEPQVIISCLGTTKKHARRGGGTYQDVDFGLNEQLISAAKQCATPPHFIYISAMGADWGRWSSYLKARMDIENLLQESGLNYSIIRPAFLTGASRDERRLLEAWGATFCRYMARFLHGIGLKGTAYTVHPLDAPDLARFIRFLLHQLTTEEGLPSEIYPIDIIHRSLDQSK